MSHEPHSTNAPRPREGFNPGAALVGLVVIALGIIFLLEALDVLSLRRDVVWPALLIAAGVAVVISALWRGRR